MRLSAILLLSILGTFAVYFGWSEDMPQDKIMFSSRKGVELESYIKALFKKENRGALGKISLSGAMSEGNIVFANLYWVTGCQPVLLYREKGKWRLLHPLREGLWGKDWADHISVGSGKYYAILDHIIEGPGPELWILYSGDKGKTWRVNGILAKNRYWSRLHDVQMNNLGRGAITLYLSKEDAIPGNPGGFYHYKTTDGGKTWSKPSYIPSEPKYTAGGPNYHSKDAIASSAPDFISLDELMVWLRAKK